MPLQYRCAPLACLLLLGACAHAPPAADPVTHARITRVLLSMERPDSAAPYAAPKTSSRVLSPDLPATVDVTHFQLPVQYNEQVKEYIDLYGQRRRQAFTTSLGRMGRYRDYIEQRLEALGLPRELVYVPLVESAFETNVASHMSAVGLWQFMKGTARSEGLEVTEYVDERRDPFRSTDAALQHLARLYGQFDSWYLAFAAYNSGSGRIARLLRERGYQKGADDTYWALADALPKETQSYVPMLLGAAIVGENAASFNLTPKFEQPIRFDEVVVPASTGLRAVARAAGVDFESVRELNPHLIKLVTPPGRRTKVRVPVGAGSNFDDAFAAIPESERK